MLNIPAAGTNVHGFLITGCDPLPELNATLVRARHEQTGARLAHLACADPNNVFALNALGDLYYGLGDNEKAIAAYQKGIEIDPSDATARFNLGELYYDMDDLESAERETLQAIRLDPNFTMSYLTLGNICIDQERVAEAIEHFENYLKREHSPQAREMIAEVKAVVEGLKEEMRAR